MKLFLKKYYKVTGSEAWVAISLGLVFSDQAISDWYIRSIGNVIWSQAWEILRGQEIIFYVFFKFSQKSLNAYLLLKSKKIFFSKKCNFFTKLL